MGSAATLSNPLPAVNPPKIPARLPGRHPQAPVGPPKISLPVLGPPGATGHPWITCQTPYLCWPPPHFPDNYPVSLTSRLWRHLNVFSENCPSTTAHRFICSASGAAPKRNLPRISRLIPKTALVPSGTPAAQFAVFPRSAARNSLFKGQFMARCGDAAKTSNPSR